MADSVDERVTDEIEALEAILLDDVIVHSENGVPHVIETVVHPSTADDTDLQFVCVTLEVTLIPQYPDTSPLVKLRNPRGLDDSVLNEINFQIQAKLEECLGMPVVFELIELIRENLTNSNLPSGQCVICLYGFSSGDAFIKTQCYHHFHNHCLSSHLVAGEKNYKEELEKLPLWQRQQAKPYQMTCPVCRESINCDVDGLGSAPPPKELLAARQFELTADLKELQQKMAQLFQHQLSRGGIIDVDADSSKLLLLTSEDTSAASANGTGSPSNDSSPEYNDLLPRQTEPLDSPETPLSPKNSRGGYRGPYRGFNRNRAANNRRGGNGNSANRNGRHVNGESSCASSSASR